MLQRMGAKHAPRPKEVAKGAECGGLKVEKATEVQLLSKTLERATADGQSTGGEAVGAGLSAAVPGDGGGTTSKNVVKMSNPLADNYDNKTCGDAKQTHWRTITITRTGQPRTKLRIWRCKRQFEACTRPCHWGGKSVCVCVS